MEQRLHGIKVVIVEDVQWIIHELVAFLKQQGCVVYECSCEEQVAGIVSFEPDVVLMDGVLGKGFTVWYGSELAEKFGLDKMNFFRLCPRCKGKPWNLELICFSCGYGRICTSPPPEKGR